MLLSRVDITHHINTMFISPPPWILVPLDVSQKSLLSTPAPNLPKKNAALTPAPYTPPYLLIIIFNK
jgi:hypothetical protein